MSAKQIGQWHQRHLQPIDTYLTKTLVPPPNPIPALPLRPGSIPAMAPNPVSTLTPVLASTRALTCICVCKRRKHTTLTKLSAIHSRSYTA
ncbi:hypothetical protein L208DRAFT_1384379 [Tricholoma matsutake]|nr:hypothetical protein L208DRAFT_1384379 [Tricholoma matsutake 945]